MYALQAHEARVWHVGLFTAVMLGGQLVGSLVLGWLADRAGHRLVIAVGAAAMTCASLTALVAPSLLLYGPVFALAGIHQAAIHVSSLNVLLEFAPSADERPTYVGLGTTTLAPVVFVAPLLAGVMVDAWGFASIFVTATVASALALGLLVARVRDPRAALPLRARGASS